MSLPWGRARRIAARAAASRPAITVALADAVGLVLAEPVTAAVALPPYDLAACDGYAVSGPGPWTVEALHGPRLPDGAATPVGLDTALPPGTDGVLAGSAAVLRRGTDATWLYVGDAASGRQAERPGHLHPGSGVRGVGELAAAGQAVVPAGTVASPAVLAAAAAAGLDVVTVVRPPDATPVVIGDARWERGLPRQGRLRDSVAPILPGALTRAGARCLPLRQVAGAPGTLADAVRDVVDDVTADLLVLTGQPGATGRADVTGALSALGATVLVADVEVRPGVDALLAELPDGRLAAYLPGDAPGALAAFVTVVAPALAAMAGRTEPDPVLALCDAPRRGHPTATSLVPATRERGELADTARLHAGTDVLSLATAEAFAVVPPGGASSGQLVELVALP